MKTDKELMGNLKTHFKKLGEITFLVIFFSLFLQGCMQSPKSKRGTTLNSASTDDTDTTSTLPTFTTGNNFIQNGASVFLSNVNLNIDFTDYLQLRGKDVDAYIRANGVNTPVCLTARFPQNNAIVLLAAVPRSVNNLTLKTLEYYYNLAPGDSSSNQSLCQKTGLINVLNTNYSTLIAKYKISDICSGTCPNLSYASQPLEMYSTNGTALTQIATKQLLLNLTNNPNGGSSTGLSCTDSAQCTGQGYSCCSLGQCVTDLAIKPNATTSPGYAQALQDILNNPSNIYNYPEFYFICSTGVNTPTNPTTPNDPIADARARLQELEDLYNCTTKKEGEYGVCTVTYKDATIGSTYSTAKDDKSFARTFTNFATDVLTLNSVERVSFGGVVMYDYSNRSDMELKEDPFPTDPATNPVKVIISGSHNDNIDSAATVQVTAKPAGATSNDLVIKYKIDASCTKVNDQVAKCEKYYIQDQGLDDSTILPELRRRRHVTNHYTNGTLAANTFKLPDYADHDKAITVTLDGVLQKQDIDWQLIPGAHYSVQFIPTNTLKVFQDQKVIISYFVDMSIHPVMASKLIAMKKINDKCACTSSMNCSLSPVKTSTDLITDYVCVYPETTPATPPLSQKVYLSSKTVPVRYFNAQGTSLSKITTSTVEEGSKYFEYRKGNLLNPNNRPDFTIANDTVDPYVGFSEIYGALGATNSSAKPAYEVTVKKGSTYDIYVDNGSLTNCYNCGSDYYSNLTRVFPGTNFGGGVSPLLGQTNRVMDGSGIRSDDLKFGRACLVPATMLPWSHSTASSGQTQRLNRMAAQHFLYANGYQYDWYGFDYGAIIGSFDGVKWFAIGTNRRIKAESSKMFLAVNVPFGDLTLESTYNVTINDGSLNPDATSMVKTDLASDGAQCQQYHQCNTDNDCSTTLGWEYACAPISEITTSWPVFDDNGREVPEASKEDNRFSSILGISSSAKRCVYRGRGALCTPNYSNINLNATFNQTTNQTLHGCSANSYCQPLTTGTTLNPKFNNNIARYGQVRVTDNGDTFGLAAIVAGRPFAFNAEETIKSPTALQNLNSNKAFAMCLPGRNIEQVSFLDQNRTVPAVASDYNGDKILGIGMSYKLNNTLPVDDYLSSCSIMDSSKNFYHNSTANPAALLSSYSTLKYDAGTQAISTNALSIFNNIFNSRNMTFGIYKNNAPATRLTGLTYTENRCLRAPGSSCFTDMDCAPSKTISDKIKSLSVDDATITAILNKYEIKFWQEELVCSQSIVKTSNLYDPKNNRCCRAVGNTISLPSADIVNGLDMTKVPGIDQPINTQTRYSRASTMYKETNYDIATTLYPELRIASKDQCNTAGGCLNKDTIKLDSQYRTFAGFAEKTSCTGDWVRNFANGTHTWETGRFQTFAPAMFQCLNWYPGNGGYTCAGLAADDPSCGIAQTSPTSLKAKEVLGYLARLELLGIPQIALEGDDIYRGSVENALSCKSYPGDRSQPYPPIDTTKPYATPTQLFNYPNPLDLSIPIVKEYRDDNANTWFSASDTTNFKSMKQVFKTDEVASCHPAGTQMKSGDNPALCCTGTINSDNLKCQLKDFIDLHVYTNRYVSSEAKILPDSLFDKYGYVKDVNNVVALACEKQMCASGVMATGVLVSRLKIPGLTSAPNKTFRFIEGAAADDLNKVLTIYNQGLKLNTHLYCVPAETTQNADLSDDLTIYSCSN